MDTIALPQPASAISLNQRDQLVFITRDGNELLIERGNEGWEKTHLPERYGLVTRLMIHNELCYVLSNRNLNLVDLRNNRHSAIASDVDDFIMSEFGELWILSGFKLIRATALGRELETQTLSNPPQSLWIVDDSLVLKYSNDTQPLPAWIHSQWLNFTGVQDSLDILKDSMLEVFQSAEANQLAFGDSTLLLMSAPQYIVKIKLSGK